MQAQIEQWIDFSTHEIDAPLCSWYYPIAGFFPYNKQVSLMPSDPATAKYFSRWSAYQRFRRPRNLVEELAYQR